MKTIYNNYGLSAIRAVETISTLSSPNEAWKSACMFYFENISSQTKSCPKGAFIGLCEEGLIKDIKAGSYFKRTKPNKNKKYAIEAIKILKVTPNISKIELWNQVRVKLDLGTMVHNSQMDVVFALWNEGLIEK